MSAGTACGSMSSKRTDMPEPQPPPVLAPQPPVSLPVTVACAGTCVSSEEHEALLQQNSAMREALDSARQELFDVYKQAGGRGGVKLWRCCCVGAEWGEVGW